MHNPDTDAPARQAGESCAGRQDDFASCDVFIAGGGLAGLGAALTLAHAASVNGMSGLRIMLADAGEAPDGRRPDLLQYPRTTALAHSSRLIFEACGLWPALRPYLQTITSVHVSDAGHRPGVILGAGDAGANPGYVIADADLCREMAVAATAAGVCLQYRTKVTGATVTSGGVQIGVTGTGEVPACHQVRAGLLILADGGRSGLSGALGFTPEVTLYNQQGILALVLHSRAHHGRAFEFFTGDGALAMLPLPDFGGRPASALIRTLPQERAQECMARDARAFAGQVQYYTGAYTGRAEIPGQRLCFALRRSAVAHPVRPGVVLLGNAAHALHPVAGQGYNLTLRDASVLAMILTRAPEMLTPAGFSGLREYLARQQRDQFMVSAFSDGLIRLFCSQHAVAKGVRRTGMSVLRHCRPLRRWFARQAAGAGGYGQ